MIFTIGYDNPNFTASQLAKILDTIGNCVLVDVRLVPFSRIKGWGTKQLISTIGKDRYISRKDLGGGNVKQEALDWLEQFDTPAAPHAMLLCKEENPGQCHRHHEICADHFPAALHIFRDEFLSAHDHDGEVERGEEPAIYALKEIRQYIADCQA